MLLEELPESLELRLLLELLDTELIPLPEVEPETLLLELNTGTLLEIELDDERLADPLARVDLVRELPE